MLSPPEEEGPNKPRYRGRVVHPQVGIHIRRQPAKLMCFARECSNHSDIEFMFLLKHAERTYVRSYPGRGSLDQSVDDRTVLLTFTGWTVS